MTRDPVARAVLRAVGVTLLFVALLGVLIASTIAAARTPEVVNGLEVVAGLSLVALFALVTHVEREARPPD